jgi:NAD(P)-dependent dehydrogenase (short-subunit alcohol dehydrogenase family)
MAKVAIVTGGSSGIGLQAALALRDSGCRVYECSRRESNVENITHMGTDLTDEAAVERAVEEVIRREGRVDILVNNAGMGISGAVEFTDTKDALRLFDVDFFGMVRICRAVLPRMREQGGGRIVNIGSVAGMVPIPFQTYYSAAKAAVHSYTMALASEVRPFGITVCALMPGDIRTGFTAAREKSPLGDDVYAGRIGRSVAAMERDEQNGMSPEKAGARIAHLCLKKRVKPLYSLGMGYQCVCALAKLLPSGLLNRAVALLYAQ